MEKENKEIPFGAKDSELYKFEYSIPEGYEAEIKDGKVIIKKKEKRDDEKIRNALINLISNDKAAGYTGFYKEAGITCDDAIAYLEKQKEQKSAEWSEEDEVTLDAVLNTLERVGDYGTIGMQKDWLKSLRPQPYWKPSEEQIDALERCVDYLDDSDNEDAAVIGSLCHNLKKLM